MPNPCKGSNRFGFNWVRGWGYNRVRLLGLEIFDRLDGFIQVRLSFINFVGAMIRKVLLATKARTAWKKNAWK